MIYAIRDFGRSYDNEEQAIQFCSQIVEKRFQREVEYYDRPENKDWSIIEIYPIQKKKLKQLCLDRFSQTLYKKYKLETPYGIRTQTVQCSYQIILT
jgi:hypothetical protein